jgi:hypothetical protein
MPMRMQSYVLSLQVFLNPRCQNKKTSASSVCAAKRARLQVHTCCTSQAPAGEHEATKQRGGAKTRTDTVMRGVAFELEQVGVAQPTALSGNPCSNCNDMRLGQL